MSISVRTLNEELTDDEPPPGLDDEEWTVEVEGQPSKFPWLARFGIVVGGIVLFLLAVAGVGPYLVPASMTLGTAERVIRDITGSQVTIRGNHSFRLLPSLRLQAENVTSAAPEGASLSFEVQKLDVELSALGILTGSVDVESMVLVEPDIQWNIDSMNAEMRDASPEFDRAWGWWRDMSLGHIRIDDARVVYTNAGTGRRLVLEQLVLQNVPPAADEAADGLAFKGQGVLNGRDLRVRIAGADPQLLVGGNRWPMKATLDTELLNARFDGSMALRQRLMGEGEISVDSSDVSQLNDWLGHVLPTRAGASLSFKAAVDSSGDGFRIQEIELKLGETQATGQISFGGFAAGAARIDGELQSTTLDLGALPAGQKVDLASFAGFMPVGRLQIAWRRALWEDLEAGAGNATLERADAGDRVSLSLGDMATYGGTVRGNVTLDRSEGMYALQMALKAIDVELGPYLSIGQAIDQPPISGQTTVNVNLFSVGGNGSELVQALTGKAELIVRNGILAMPELVNGLAPERGDHIAFETMNGSFAIAQGIANSEDLILRADGLSLVGKGRIDLADWSVDLNVGRLGGDAAARTFKRFRVMGRVEQIDVEAIN